MNKLICLVGMCGSGKSVIADELVKRGYGFFRFGQITLDIVKERGLEPIEANERPIRDGLREKYGKGAYAILNKPKIARLLQTGNVVGDGLYSWDEYKILEKEYGDQFIAIAVYAPPKLRYERISARKMAQDDVDMRNRSFTQEEARARDIAEIEISDKGGPIAMAHHTLVNTGTVQDLLAQFEHVMQRIQS
jgi:dephospho-CoA kinase